MTVIALSITTTLAAALFAYELYAYLTKKEIRMLTQDEQAILDVVRGLVTKVESSDADIAAANTRATTAEAALAAEQAAHAELVQSLQTVITSAA